MSSPFPCDVASRANPQSCIAFRGPAVAAFSFVCLASSLLVSRQPKGENMSILSQSSLNSSSDKIQTLFKTANATKPENFWSEKCSAYLKRWNKTVQGTSFCFYCHATHATISKNIPIQSNMMVFEHLKGSSLNCKIIGWKIVALLKLLASFSPVPPVVSFRAKFC